MYIYIHIYLCASQLSPYDTANKPASADFLSQSQPQVANAIRRLLRTATLVGTTPISAGKRSFH